ncbi:L-threonylcarbamoyladenylate synthase [Dyadobacter psychrotolerans]|uniref:Threonylcarbamoyl-AMP synthase n=1 Tax=Dyadobacter psychrotolerans TaxID=2541721 RepID=A0A4R5DXP9_9BACT|nr:L-threonylcarbamoyladenylate synthase [Dyadobacter psychrotolerans]TDE17444.1 threonylcarbamoyl-AMP synthase [Dyadobacter psychrotolerans]
MATTGNDISLAKHFLLKGDLVAIPTETVYGLAANAFNEKAVLSIFEVKNRPAFDPLIIHTDALEKVKDFVTEIPPQAMELAKAFWPGPLTLLLTKKNNIPDLVTSGLDQVAVRIPNHALTLELLSQLDFPLAAPSANPFGYISPTEAAHVNAQLGDKIPYILDGGLCGVGIESTIIGFIDDVPTVFRLGGLSVDEIERVVGKVNIMKHSSSNPQAPGMLKSHYAPRKPFFIKTKSEIESAGSGVAALLFDKKTANGAVKYQRILSPAGNLNEAARNLFAYLRELDLLDIEEIWAEKAPETGLGLAINDRLKRAAAH